MEATEERKSSDLHNNHSIKLETYGVTADEQTKGFIKQELSRIFKANKAFLHKHIDVLVNNGFDRNLLEKAYNSMEKLDPIKTFPGA